jgi:hypothetical protein
MTSSAMDLTLQSYLNEAVFSSGRGQEATFVSYLQKDSSKFSDKNSAKFSTKSLRRDKETGKESSSPSNGKSEQQEFDRKKYAEFDRKKYTEDFDRRNEGEEFLRKSSFISYIDDDSDTDGNFDDYSVGSVSM